MRGDGNGMDVYFTGGAFNQGNGDGHGGAPDSSFTSGNTTVTVGGKAYTAEPLSPMVTALAKEGGIVAAIRRFGPRTFARLQAG